MKNDLIALNNYLFEQIERLNDDDLTDEGLDREIRKSESIAKVSEKILDTGELLFKVMKHADEYGYGQNKSIPAMLSAGEGQRHGNQ